MNAIQIGECGKRCYQSEAGARRANRYARFRVRAYRCSRCRNAWHVCNGDKR